MISLQRHPPEHLCPWRWLICAACGLLLAGPLALTGCAPDKPNVTPPPARYTEIPARENVPDFMRGTIWEIADVENKVYYPVSSYGLVVGLRGTGNNSGTPMSVRGHMLDEMVRHGFGSHVAGTRKLQPEAILRDPNTAIVEVYAFLPPGARSGQRLDVFVNAVNGSQTQSLAHGTLYQTDLYVGGVDPINPKGRVNTYARAQGPIFVNPVHVKADSSTRPSVYNQRAGVVMNGGLVAMDRPIWLRVRTPSLRTTRVVELRIDQRFQDEGVAKTQDEGIVHVYVPRGFRGDWEHFVGVATHTYINGAPGFLADKAKQLAAEAQKPGAALLDISYCWEGIGELALPFVQPLYLNKSPEVAFAAARAGAYVGDLTAEEALLAMARDDRNPFQVSAVKALGSLDSSPRIDRMLAGLLDSSSALVRIEAYRVLAEHESPLVVSRLVHGEFVLDQVICKGPPLIYASRSGVPRIAIFGQNLSVRTPIMFSAMNGKFTISSTPGTDGVVLFDRTMPRFPAGVQARSRPDISEILRRLSGAGEDGFQFGYADLVGLLQSLSDGKHVPASFVLQDLPGMRDDIDEAPPLPEPPANTLAPEAADPMMPRAISGR